MIRVDITPQLAQHLLDTVDDGKYRPVNMTYVNRFMWIILAGDWRESIPPVSIDPYGRLRDGRLRLMAVVAANVTVKMTMDLVSAT